MKGIKFDINGDDVSIVKPQIELEDGAGDVCLHGKQCEHCLVDEYQMICMHKDINISPFSMKSCPLLKWYNRSKVTYDDYLTNEQIDSWEEDYE